MMPVLFRIPALGWDLPAYGLMLTVGFLLSIVWAVRRAERSGANPDVILNCGFIALAGGIGGARLMYVVHYWEQFSKPTMFETLRAIIDVTKGGLEVYGGFIVVVIGVLAYLIAYRHSIRWYLDIMAPSAALGMAIGRIGCFLNGCCFGGPADLPWAVRFPYGSPPALQQWQEGEPGAGLPRQLLLFADRAYPDGATANPLPREVVTTPLREFEALQKRLDALSAQVKAKRADLAKAVDPAERKRIQGEIDALEARERQRMIKVTTGCAPPPVYTLNQMRKYGLSAEELRAIAHQHPSLPTQPTQLYSTLALGLLALLLDALYWRRTRDGQVICLLLLIEPWTRWTLELLRADNPVDTFGTFTISQALAIALSLIGLIGLLALHNATPRSPRAVKWVPPEPPGPPPNKRAARS